MVRSRIAAKTTARSASSEKAVKPSKPGRTMISTPLKTDQDRYQRRQPTGSARKKAATIVTGQRQGLP